MSKFTQTAAPKREYIIFILLGVVRSEELLTFVWILSHCTEEKKNRSQEPDDLNIQSYFATSKIMLAWQDLIEEKNCNISISKLALQVPLIPWHKIQIHIFLFLAAFFFLIVSEYFIKWKWNKREWEWSEIMETDTVDLSVSVGEGLKAFIV